MGYICSLHPVEEVHEEVDHEFEEVALEAMVRGREGRTVVGHESQGGGEDGAACGGKYRFWSADSTFSDFSTRNIQFSR